MRDPLEAATIAVGAVVVDRSGRVLLIRRGKPPGKGQWTLPGGRVEQGESNEDAVLRELVEETSLRARVVAPLGVVVIEREGFRYAIHEFLCVALGIDGAGVAADAASHAANDDAVHGAVLEPRAGDDAAEARWVDVSLMESLGVKPDACAVIERGIAEARAQRLVDGEERKCERT